MMFFSLQWFRILSFLPIITYVRIFWTRCHFQFNRFWASCCRIPHKWMQNVRLKTQKEIACPMLLYYVTWKSPEVVAALSVMIHSLYFQQKPSLRGHEYHRWCSHMQGFTRAVFIDLLSGVTWIQLCVQVKEQITFSGGFLSGVLEIIQLHTWRSLWLRVDLKEVGKRCE